MRHLIRSGTQAGTNLAIVGIIYQQYLDGDKHWWVFYHLRWDRKKDPESGKRLDRCNTVYDVEDFLRFCQERDYKCILVDKDMTAEVSLKTMEKFVGRRQTGGVGVTFGYCLCRRKVSYESTEQ